MTPKFTESVGNLSDEELNEASEGVSFARESNPTLETYFGCIDASLQNEISRRTGGLPIETVNPVNWSALTDDSILVIAKALLIWMKSLRKASRIDSALATFVYECGHTIRNQVRKRELQDRYNALALTIGEPRMPKSDWI